MATYKEIFEVEKVRESADQWNVIHLFPDGGNSYKAYEWSAWLAREFATNDEWRKQVGVKPLSPVHKSVKSTTGSIIFVGFPTTSLDKFVPKDFQKGFTPVDNGRIDIAVELPAEIGEVSFEAMQQKFQEWKKQWPLKGGKETPEASAGKDALDVQSLLSVPSGRPMRMSDILAQIVALPVEDISPNDALKVLRILKRQCASLF